MAAVTLATLIARARERADMVGSTFVSDEAFTDFISEGWQILWEKLIAAYASDYAEKQATINLVGGQSDYTLPADFFKLYGVDWNNGGMVAVVSLEPYNRAERNTYRNANIALSAPYVVPRYKLGQSADGASQVIRLLPDSATGSLTIFYAPVATLLADDADTIDVLNGWERYIVIYAAIQALLKEESSTTALMAEREKMEEQLKEMAENRDIGTPLANVDVDNINFWLL